MSTPIRRMHANAASRMRWYSTSDSVWAGATVIESPVCTPIGSKFSIEQTTTQLSAWSRMTSSSYSFQPAIDRSMRISRDRAGVETDRRQSPQLVGVGGDAGARAAEDERRPDDDREADVVRDGHDLVERVGEARGRDGETDLGHGRLELLAVLGRVDRLGVGADELDAVLGEHAAFDELHGQVERGLTAERRQERVGALALDDGGEDVDVERLDVGAVGEVGVGHDRRRVRVGEDDPVALLPQHAARLGPGVVELAGLADDDRPAADEQDGLDVVATRQSADPCPSDRRTASNR